MEFSERKRQREENAQFNIHLHLLSKHAHLVAFWIAAENRLGWLAFGWGVLGVVMTGAVIGNVIEKGPVLSNFNIAAATAFNALLSASFLWRAFRNMQYANCHALVLDVVHRHDEKALLDQIDPQDLAVVEAGSKRPALAATTAPPPRPGP